MRIPHNSQPCPATPALPRGRCCWSAHLPIHTDHASGCSFPPQLYGLPAPVSRGARRARLPHHVQLAVQRDADLLGRKQHKNALGLPISICQRKAASTPALHVPCANVPLYRAQLAWLLDDSWKAVRRYTVRTSGACRGANGGSCRADLVSNVSKLQTYCTYHQYRLIIQHHQHAWPTVLCNQFGLAAMPAAPIGCPPMLSHPPARRAAGTAAHPPGTRRAAAPASQAPGRRLLGWKVAG